MFRAITLVLLALVGLAVLVAGTFYARDGAIEATVQDKSCSLFGPGAVTVKTKFLGIDHTVQGVAPEACATVQPGNYVEYHVRSQRTKLYDADGGRCLFDSERGLGC
ncbi:MAG TPA: hypothetical protein VFH47_05855 [Candidatus Thermoplasmatota archaeon]|nr:hypothetical protein [Candidatus Thermoplasmatota archaeon]